MLLLRMVHLSADFPNHSFWADDHAKYSDEGWYANAAINSVLLGHWYVPGDWAPAVVMPAWPALMTGIFHVTGVSVVAARAAEAIFSWLALMLAWLIFRRYNSVTATWLFVLLAAASASAFFFSRLAILERPLEACALLCVLIAGSLRRESWWQQIVLGAGIVLLVLIKTTGAFLIPAILYPIWFRYRSDWRKAIRPLAVTSVTAAVLFAAERILFANHYSAAYSAFFIHDDAHAEFFGSARKAFRLLYRGTWIDPLLWPVACAALAISVWMRSLWGNVLWGVCTLWIVGYAAFIVYHFDGPPRYFTVLMLPVFMLVAMFLSALWKNHRGTAWLVAALCVVSVSWNLWQTQKSLRHPDYSMLSATEQIRRVIDAHPEQARLILGHAANETSLFIAVPSIDDTNGDWSETKKLAAYQPGWFLIWNDEIPADYAEVTAQRKLVPMLSVPAFDDKARDHLQLFAIRPIDGSESGSNR